MSNTNESRSPAVSKQSGASQEVLDAVLERANHVAAKLAETAAASDRANRSPREEIELLRENDLLQVQEPVAYGGSGLSYAQNVGHAFSPYQTLVTPHWQLAAEGALAEAFAWTRAHATPWETAGVERATDDAYILQTAGELVSQVRAAALLADRAGQALQRAIDVGPSLSEEQRAEAAIAVYEAKYLTTKVSLETASRLFEIQGARATSAKYGFDRHFRNLRTHTVHDPVAYKAREVGDWALNRRGPEFSLYR